jgi:hypothetical protein
MDWSAAFRPPARCGERRRRYKPLYRPAATIREAHRRLARSLPEVCTASCKRGRLGPESANSHQRHGRNTICSRTVGHRSDASAETCAAHGPRGHLRRQEYHHHLLRHEYGHVDNRVMWRVVEKYFPELKSVVRDMLPLRNCRDHDPEFSAGPDSRWRVIERDARDTEAAG